MPGSRFEVDLIANMLTAATVTSEDRICPSGRWRSDGPGELD